MAQMMPDLSSLKETACIDCPKSMVGRVIGKGGETIKALQQYTGAMIQIDQSQDPTKVTIAGTPQSLQLAVSMVNDIVCGHFKGFALLRQLTSRTGQQLVQPQPVYVEGYGFVPLSQFCGDDAGSTGAAQSLHDTLSPSEMLLMAAQQKYSLRSQSLPVGNMHAAMGQQPGALDSEQLRHLAQEFSNPFLAAASLGTSNGAGIQEHHVPQLTTNFEMNGGSGRNSPDRAPAGAQVPLPNGWMHIHDPDGRAFYYNIITKQSQWQAPHEM